MSNKEHPLAHILRAIADGVPVQGKWNSDDDWWDFDPEKHALSLTGKNLQFRIKPKPKVKKWRWVVKRPHSGMFVTDSYYTDVEVSGFPAIAVQKIDSTMIEVEE